jgi:hypothetical protein
LDTHLRFSQNDCVIVRDTTVAFKGFMMKDSVGWKASNRQTAPFNHDSDLYTLQRWPVWPTKFDLKNYDRLVLPINMSHWYNREFLKAKSHQS